MAYVDSSYVLAGMDSRQPRDDGSRSTSKTSRDGRRLVEGVGFGVGESTE